MTTPGQGRAGWAQHRHLIKFSRAPPRTVRGTREETGEPASDGVGRDLHDVLAGRAGCGSSHDVVQVVGPRLPAAGYRLGRSPLCPGPDGPGPARGTLRSRPASGKPRGVRQRRSHNGVSRSGHGPIGGDRQRGKRGPWRGKLGADGGLPGTGSPGVFGGRLRPRVRLVREWDLCRAPPRSIVGRLGVRAVSH